MTDREEIVTGLVLRLGRRDITGRHFPAGLMPDIDDFGLSDTEKKEACEPEGVGKLSVWDKSITPAMANAFMEQPTKTRIVLDVDVPTVVAYSHQLHVYVEPADKEYEGKDAHRVIEDVWREDKNLRRAIQSDLVSASKAIGRVLDTVFTEE